MCALIKYKKYELKKTKLEKIWQNGKITVIQTRNKCEKMACKHKTVQNREKNKNHK